MVTTFRLFILATFALLSGCASQSASVYQQLGGQAKIEQITANFIQEIEGDKVIAAYFAETNMQRFREKFIEHLCVHTGGPCQYTGDSMLDVHAGMNINPADFNRTVELLINAMTAADVPHPLQNKVLAELAPMRGEMLYQ